MPTKEQLRVATKIARNKARRLQTQVGSGGRMCMPVAASDVPIYTNREWVIDSGSCVILVNIDELTQDESSRIRPVPGGPENLITAAGPTVANREVSIRLGSCNSSATALVLDGTPSVLSLGRLVEEGFSFEWRAGREPVLTDKRG